MKKDKQKQIASKYFNLLVTKANKNHRCHACGIQIRQGTFYLDIFIYKSLWYKFHTSTKCRLIASYASSMMIDPHNVKETTKEDLEWFYNDKCHNLSASFCGFKSLKIALKEVKRIYG